MLVTFLSMALDLTCSGVHSTGSRKNLVLTCFGSGTTMAHLSEKQRKSRTQLQRWHWLDVTTFDTFTFSGVCFTKWMARMGYPASHQEPWSVPLYRYSPHNIVSHGRDQRVVFLNRLHLREVREPMKRSAQTLRIFPWQELSRLQIIAVSVELVLEAARTTLRLWALDLRVSVVGLFQWATHVPQKFAVPGSRRMVVHKIHCCAIRSSQAVRRTLKSVPQAQCVQHGCPSVDSGRFHKSLLDHRRNDQHA